MALAGQPADDAATLAFGPEFPLDSCECLSDAEVTTILDTHLRSSAAADRPFPRKALEYARRNVGARPLEAVKTGKRPSWQSTISTVVDEPRSPGSRAPGRSLAH